MTMTYETHNHLKPKLLLILSAATLGICFGLSNTTWQVAVESGQALAHLVEYPPHNPFFIYHMKGFTFANHFSAILLRLFNSEIIVSTIISAILGATSFTALALFVFAFNRSILISLVTVLFIYLTDTLGDGLIYPIWLLGYQHTYGILGLAFAVLVIALYAAGLTNAAIFCLPLSFYIHPVWGLWLIFVTLITAIFEPKRIIHTLKKHYWPLILGLLICSIGLIYHLKNQIYFAKLPSLDDPTIKSLLYSYIKYYDSHRRPICALLSPANFRAWAMIYCIYTAIASAISLKSFKNDYNLSFVLKLIITSAILSIPAAFISCIDPEKLPPQLLILMPARLINLNNLMITPLLLGLLTTRKLQPYITNYNLFIATLISFFFSRHDEVLIILFALLLTWLIYYSLKNRQSTPLLTTRSHRLSYTHLLLICLAIFLAINLPRPNYRTKFIKKPPLQDRTNNSFYHTIATRPGLLLTTHYDGFIQLKTRRPILADMASPNFFIYALQGLPKFNSILKDIYEIDIRTPPPPEYRHRELPPILYQQTWENRTTTSWQRLAEKYQFTDILTPINWKLNLPIVAKSEDRILYTIPPIQPSRDANPLSSGPDRTSELSDEHSHIAQTSPSQN